MTQEPFNPPSRPADAHLRFDAGADLKRRTTRSGALMILSFGVQLGIGIVGTAILARLLQPEDFGYLAMVTTLTNFIVTFREFLLTPAVQQQDLTHEQASGLFWINCLASVAVAALVAGMAPVLVWFFGEPRLLWITLILSPGILLNMLSMLHIGLLRRRMQFAAIAVIEIGAIVAGVAVGVAAALLGAGYWALVYQQMAVWIWQTVAALIACPWRAAPLSASRFHSDAAMRSMLHYGKNTTAARVMTYVGRNTDSVLIGHFLGAATLGLYQKAYQWAMMPFLQIYTPMSAVAVASFSRLQSHPGRYRNYARTTLLGIFGLTLPATALVVIEADHIVPLLLGDKWLDAVPMLRLLGVGAWFSIYTLVTNWLYLPEGRAAEQLRWSLVAAPVTMLAVAIGTHWGAIGVAGGFTTASALLVAPGIWYCLRRSPVTFADFYQSAWRATIASLVAAGLTILLRKPIPQMRFIFERFGVNAAIFTVIYICVWLILPGGRANWVMFMRQLRSAAGASDRRAATESST